MHSAAGIEDRLFTPARVRLTAWYVSVLAAVLVVLGSTLYLTVRQQLLSSVDDGVRLVAERASEQWLIGHPIGRLARQQRQSALRDRFN